MRPFVHDLRSALRGIRRSPGLALLVVGSLAIGIGIPASLASFADALVLHPLSGLREPNRLVTVHRITTEEPDQLGAFSLPDYRDIVESGDLFEGVAAYSTFDFNVSSGATSRRVQGLAVTPNYFELLGASADAGRMPSRGDSFDGPVVVVSHELGETLGGPDGKLAGRVIEINGTPVDVVAVAHPDFVGVSRVDAPELWLPMASFEEVVRGPFATIPDPFSRHQEWLSLVARLAPERSQSDTQQRLLGLMRRLQDEYPDTNEGELAVIKPVERTAYGASNEIEIRRYAALLALVAGVTLFIALVNVSAVLMTRYLSRRKELVIRAALGASRKLLVRFVMMEALVMVAAGALLSVGIAAVALPLMEFLVVPGRGLVELSPSLRTLAVMVGAIVLVGGPVAVIPALKGSRPEIARALRGYSPGGGRGRTGVWRKVLVGVQAAMAVVVLVGAGLLGRTIANLKAIDPGFAPESTVVASVDPGSAGLDPYETADFWDRLQEQIRRLPPVEAVGLASGLPAVGANFEVILTVSSPDVIRAEVLDTPVRHVMVEGGFFDAIRVRTLAGRVFAERDAHSPARVVVVNESMAATFWPDRDAVGQRIHLASNEGPFTIIGVVEDFIFADLRDKPLPQVYLDRRQHDMSFLGPMMTSPMTLVAKTTSDPLSVVPAIRQAVREIDPRLPVYGVRTIEGVLDDAFELQSQIALLLGIVGGVALALAFVGLYGILDHAVVARRPEIAVRFALGAEPSDVMRRMLIRGTRPFVLGSLCGLVAAVGLGRVLESQLYGVDIFDPLTYGATLVIVMGLGFVFSFIPTSRVARISLGTALSHE